MVKSIYAPQLLVIAIAAANMSLANAEEAENAIDEVVVTGVAGKQVTKLEASISVSAMSDQDIEKASPRSIAEVFRSLPGIRAESSGGGGNANMTIRGIPLATGGSKYMQIHEDGLPVLEFGDINFGNTDNFLRFDANVARVESVRGGSASTLASNSPGGIINVLSKVGDTEGGSVSGSFGVDYNEFRTDFDYGGRLSDSMYYHIGGFFRNGEGVRDVGFNGDNGGQIKFSLTKELDGGYIRFNLKDLDDQVATYLPSPVKYHGGGEFGSVPGYDASRQSLQSPFTNNITTFDAYGNPESRNVSSGIHSKVRAFGFEFDKDLADGLHINNKFRSSSISGSFISPFTDGFAGGTATIAQKGADLCSSAKVGGVALDCSGGVLAMVDGKAANSNQLAFTNLLFDTRFNDLGLDVNDVKLTKEFGDLSVTAGYYYSKQSINTTWASWHTRMQTLEGGKAKNIHYEAVNAGIDADGNKVNVVLADHGALTQSFLSWDWDLQYTTTAPYFDLSYKASDRLTLEAGMRFDSIEARGMRLDHCCGGNMSTDLNGNGNIGSFTIVNGKFTRLDSDALLENAKGSSAGFINGGVIRLNESNANKTPVNYDANNTSYTLGGTYILTDDSSVFTRYSSGGRAIADRLTQVAGSLQSNGALSSTTDGYDNVKQIEVGYKYISNGLSYFATVFNTHVEETNAELTSGLTFVREYKTNGIELEANYDISSDWTLRGNVTWTDAEISKDATNPAVVGNAPRRQANYIWTLSPEYHINDLTVGLSMQGTSAFNLGDNADANTHLYQKAYNLFNVYASYQFTDALSASLNINNLTNVFALTEAEETTGSAGSIVRGRPVSARSTSFTLRYQF